MSGVCGTCHAVTYDTDLWEESVRFRRKGIDAERIVLGHVCRECKPGEIEFIKANRDIAAIQARRRNARLQHSLFPTPTEEGAP